MARPKTSDKPSPPKTIEEAVERGLISADDIPADRPDNDVVAEKIEFAIEALERKAAALDEVGAVRELLTLLIKTGSGSRDQVLWVRFNLPRKGSMKETVEGEQETTETTESVAA